MTAPALAAAEVFKARNTIGQPETAILLGRGFQGMADLGEKSVAIPYSELPGFPNIDGEAIICAIDGAPTLLLKGNPSFYETGDPSLMTGAIESLTHVGVRGIFSPGFVTSVRADLMPGSLVVITDHINLTGLNPLIGSADGIGLNLNEAYDKRLFRRSKMAALAGGVAIHDGILMWFSGPSFETHAEGKMARGLGADVLGWTIAPEAILAHRFGIPFLGLGLVTDTAAGSLGGSPSGNLGRGPIIAGLIALRRFLRGYLKSK